MSDELIRSLRSVNKQLKAEIEKQNAELQEWADKFETAVNEVKIELEALSPEAEALKRENEKLRSELKKIKLLGTYDMGLAHYIACNAIGEDKPKNEQRISKDKTYRTRDGREAIIVKTDYEDFAFTVIAAVRNTDGEYGLCYFTETGKARIAPHPYVEDDPLDLIEVNDRVNKLRQEALGLSGVKQDGSN